MAPAQPPQPPDDGDTGENEQDLAALGFLFDAAAAKTWVKHTSTSYPSHPGNDAEPNCSTSVPKLVEVEVQVIDDEDGPGALQTGQRTWPAAPFLADYLVQHWAKVVIANRRCHVLELGAGCGLLGLTLAQLPGIDSVLMTDHDPGTLVLIREGIVRNRARLREGVRCEAALLEWGGRVDARFLPVPRQEGEKYNPRLLIVGSDLIYSADVVISLFETVAGVLRKRKEEESSPAEAGAEDRFWLCGSFALGEAIDKKMEEVVDRLRLSREVVPLGDDLGAKNKAMWLHVYTFTSRRDSGDRDERASSVEVSKGLKK